MIKDISEISQLDAELMDTEENANDFYEIVEFVRIGVLFIPVSYTHLTLPTILRV